MNTQLAHQLPHRQPNRLLQRLSTWLAVGLIACLAGCSAITAQNPNGSYAPVNAHVEGESNRVMLKGHDVVSYFTQNKHALGSPAISSQYEGITFRFANAEHKALFDKEPTKYLPQYGGYCADGIVYGIPWGGDADTWIMKDGKLYIFGGQSSKDAWLLNLHDNYATADKLWNYEIKGSNSFYQRLKRLTFKVPYYKTGGELAALVEARKAGK
jgi:YHS domain-containing protein